MCTFFGCDKNYFVMEVLYFQHVGRFKPISMYFCKGVKAMNNGIKSEKSCHFLH